MNKYSIEKIGVTDRENAPKVRVAILKRHTIENKCIGCFDTGIINKGTKVEEICPICNKAPKISRFKKIIKSFKNWNDKMNKDLSKFNNNTQIGKFF